MAFVKLSQEGHPPHGLVVEIHADNDDVQPAAGRDFQEFLGTGRKSNNDKTRIARQGLSQELAMDATVVADQNVDWPQIMKLRRRHPSPPNYSQHPGGRILATLIW